MRKHRRNDEAELNHAAQEPPNRLDILDGAPDPLFSRKAGEICVYVNNASLYFGAGDDDDETDADAAGWNDETASLALKFKIEYFDKGTETIRLGYTTNGTTETLTTIVTKTNTKKWLKAHITVNAAKFGTAYYGIDDNEAVGGGGDHYNADFRLVSTGDLFIKSIAITNRTTKASLRFPAFDYLNQSGVVPPEQLPGTGDEFDDNLLAGWLVAPTKFSADSESVVLDSATPAIMLGGASAFGTGTGIWQGKDSGVYKWRVGNPSGNKAEWDGSAFAVTGAITATSGSISGTLTIVAGGKILAGTAGAARVEISDTGIKQYDSGNNQRSQLLNDGSGWLGSSSVFNWTTAGVVSLNGSAVVGNSLDAGKVSFYAPTLSGLTFTNNSPSAGYVAWSSFTLTYQGVSYTIASGNSNSKYIYWKKSVSTTVLQTSATIPANAPDMFIACVNFSGTAYPSNFAPFIYADYINVGQLSAISAAMGTLTSGTILGARIATSDTGARTELHSTNLFGMGFGGIGGTDGTTAQWYAKASDGKFYCSGGNAGADANGFWVIPDTAIFNPLRSYKFLDGATTTGGVYGRKTNATNSIRLQSLGVDGLDSEASVLAFASSGKVSVAALHAYHSDGAHFGGLSILCQTDGTADANLYAERITFYGGLSLIETTVDLASNIANPLDTGNYSFVRLSYSGGAFIIRGIAPTTTNKILILVSYNNANMTLAHQNTNATAGRRIITPTAADITCKTAILVRDSTTNRWRVVSYA